MHLGSVQAPARGLLPADVEIKARRFCRRWQQLGRSAAHRGRSPAPERLVMVHPLRAADALQLAAALVWAADPPRDWVCLS